MWHKVNRIECLHAAEHATHQGLMVNAVGPWRFQVSTAQIDQLKSSQPTVTTCPCGRVLNCTPPPPPPLLLLLLLLLDLAAVRQVSEQHCWQLAGVLQWLTMLEATNQVGYSTHGGSAQNMLQ
jgi:hypothetical protein